MSGQSTIDSMDDLMSLVAGTGVGISVIEGNVTLNFGDMTKEQIAELKNSNEGVKLLSDLISAQENYLYEAGTKEQARDRDTGESFGGEENPSNEATFANLMSAIINNIGVPAGTFVDGVGYGQGSSLPFTPGWGAKDGTGAPPMAYLNWMVFDRNYSQDLGRSGYMRITTNAKETGTNATHDKLFSPEITITQPGYVYIWLSNENPTPVEVYFDDFKVTQVKSPVIQQDDYYAFGLTFNSYSRENSVAQDFKYNGKEEQTELGIGWLDYGARMYMPEIGRFGKLDRYSFKYFDLSPYGYAGNNPTNFIDINGDSLQYVGSLQQIAFLLLKSAESCGCKITSKANGTDKEGNAIFKVMGFESVDKDYELQQSDLKTIIESKDMYTERFIATKKGFLDDVEYYGGAMYEPKTRTTYYADHWMRGGWDEDMGGGSPSYSYATNEAASTGDYIAYKVVSLFTTPENNPYAKQVSRLIPFAEAIMHERRHAVNHDRNNINGSRADNENNAIRPLNRWYEKKGLPKRPLLE
jgi:RHS repeat-associated protein